MSTTNRDTFPEIVKCFIRKPNSFYSTEIRRNDFEALRNRYSIRDLNHPKCKCRNNLTTLDNALTETKNQNIEKKMKALNRRRVSIRINPYYQYTQRSGIQLLFMAVEIEVHITFNTR